MRTGDTASTRDRKGALPAFLLVLIAALLSLSPIVPVAAQKGTLSSAEATVPPIDDAASERLKDIFGSEDTPAEDPGTPEAVSDSFTSDDFGFTVSYETPWSYNGWWTTDGVVTHYLAWDGTPAGIYITGWEWPDDVTIRDYVAWWADPAYIEEWMPGAEGLRFKATDTVGGVVHLSTPTDEFPEPWVYVTELHLVGPYAIETIFFAPLSEFGEAYETTVGLHAANDVPLFTIFAPDEIEEMLPANVAYGS